MKTIYFISVFLFIALFNYLWVKVEPYMVHHYLYLSSNHVPEDTDTTINTNGADLIVFSYDRPLQLYAFLETLKRNVSGIEEKHVIYKTSDDRYEEGYAIVKEDFPDVIFHAQTRQPTGDFKELVLKVTRQSKSDYISYAVDDILITHPFDIRNCVSAMNKYDAYTFSVRCGLNLDYDHSYGKKNLSYFEMTPEGMCLWTIHNGTRIWRYPNHVDFSLHRKNEILPDLQTITFSAPNSMEEGWARLLYVNVYEYLPTQKTRLVQLSATGFKRALAFKESKMVNIPLNLVNAENMNRNMGYSPEHLNERFIEGYKLDTESFQGYVNDRVHENHFPQFIMRL